MSDSKRTKQAESATQHLIGLGVSAKDVQRFRKKWTASRCEAFLERHGKKLRDAMALAAWHYLDSALALEEAQWREAARLKQYEVKFKASTGDDRFSDEHGFGTNPPAIYFAESEKALRKALALKMKRDRVKIASVKQVGR